jgi:segregation and condensation protein A
LDSYTIQLPIYQGPLDLLLELIERAELDITKVALAQVTDQYLAYLHQLHERQLEDLAAFLVIAARLLQIKSEALLPRPPERDPGEEDPGDALARQLVAYKKYKQVAILLSEREEKGLRTFLRVAAPPQIEPKLDLSGVSAYEIYTAFLEALESHPEVADVGQVIIAPRVSIREQMHRIVDTLRRAGNASFRRLFGEARNRVELVVSFLAVLELIKQRRITASQESLFGDIKILPGDRWQSGQEGLEFDLEFEE